MNLAAVACDVSVISWIAFSSTASARNAPRKTWTSAWLEWRASLPPRKITAFPVLKHSADASTVTLGRASKIMPITPSGTRSLAIINPASLRHARSTFPIGSGKLTTCLSPVAISWMRSAVSRSRSTNLTGTCGFSKSCALAANISSWWLVNAVAIAVNTWFFCAVESNPSV